MTSKRHRRKIIKKLAKLWDKQPALRLGQLIGNRLEAGLYYISDEAFIETLEKFYNQT